MFWESNPRKIKIYTKANKIKMQVQDEVIWSACGNYVLSAVFVAVEHCLAGNKAKSKYIEQPISKIIEERNRPLTEEELQRQRELFVQEIENMRIRFQKHHKAKKKSGKAVDD